MKKICMTMLAMTGAATIAHADTRYYSGTSCLGNTSGDNQYLARSDDGCWNSYTLPATTCSSPLGVILPIDGNSSDTVQYTSLSVFYQLDGGTLACHATVGNRSGTEYVGSTVNTSTPGNSTLSFSGSALPNSGSSISSAAVQHIYCSLPGRQLEAFGTSCKSSYSYILGYARTTSGS